MEAVGAANVGIAFTTTDVPKEIQPVVVSFTVMEKVVFAAEFENVGLD